MPYSGPWYRPRYHLRLGRTSGIEGEIPTRGRTSYRYGDCMTLDELHDTILGSHAGEWNRADSGSFTYLERLDEVTERSSGDEQH